MRRVPENRKLSDVTCYITARLKSNSVFAKNTNAEIAESALLFYRHQKTIELYGYVIMPDHIHLLVKILEPNTISKWIGQYKSYVSHQINLGRIWQIGSWTEIIEGHKLFKEKLDYIHNNPVRSKFVVEPQAYKWSSAKYFYSDNPEKWIDPVITITT